MLAKTQVVLYLYNEFLEGKRISTDEIVGEYGMSIRTFRRYISELNAFFSNFNKPFIIRFSKKGKSYYLTRIA